jgi:hypothetical protein
MDANGAANWDFNNNYAQFIITNNVTATKMVHIGQCKTMCAMWASDVAQS